MKFLKRFELLLGAVLVSMVVAFQPPPPSFAGRASSVFNRAERSTEFIYPSIVSSLGTRTRRRGMNMSILPPFLKNLGLKTPEKPISGEETNSVLSDSFPLLKEEESAIPSDAKMLEEEDGEESCEIKEEMDLSKTENLLKQVKDSGPAGIISYALWELGFWVLSIPVCIFGYYELVGHLPDFSNKEDLAKLSGEAFAFVNFARFAVPLRIGLALTTTPWIQENVVDRFMKKQDACIDPGE